MSEIDDAILDVAAAALFTGLRPASLAKMRSVGGGPMFIKAGRKVLYRRSDLVEWLNRRRVRSTTEAHHSLPCRLTDDLRKSPSLKK
jgi:hypothetical protein